MRMRTQKPWCIISVFRNDFLSVASRGRELPGGGDVTPPEYGTGVSTVAMVGAGGRENACIRVVEPRRVEGRESRLFGSVNVGPGMDVNEETQKRTATNP